MVRHMNTSSTQKMQVLPLLGHWTVEPTRSYTIPMMGQNFLPNLGFQAAVNEVGGALLFSVLFLGRSHNIRQKCVKNECASAHRLYVSPYCPCIKIINSIGCQSS